MQLHRVGLLSRCHHTHFLWLMTASHLAEKGPHSFVASTARELLTITPPPANDALDASKSKGRE